MNKNIPKRRFKGFNENWEVKSLKVLGYTYNSLSGMTKDDFDKGTSKYITYLNVFHNSITRIDELEKVRVNKKQNKVLNGDIFFTTSSETPEEVGMTSVWTHNLDNVYLNSFCFGYRFYEKTNPYFIANLFRSSGFRKEIELLAQGISRFNISKQRVMDLSIAYPSDNEQKQIGEFFQKLDNMIKIQSNKIKKYELLKESYLEKMLPEKSQNVPELRFKNFNYEWEKLVFKEQFKVSQGLQIPINERYTTSGIGKYFYITIEFLKDNNMKKYYIKEPNKTVVSNMTDILMVRTGNVGVVLTDIIGCFHNNFFKVDYNRKEFYQYYLYHKFTSPKFQRKLLANSGSSTIPDLSHTSFYSIEEFFPMFEEQKKIGDFFQKIDNIIELQNEKLDKLKNLKQAYLNEMFVN